MAILTFKNAEGTWTGILKTTPRARHDDWVTLVIRENGSYQFESVRTIGVLQGQGTFTLTDGKLRTDTEGGSAVATLYEEGGRRMLKVEATAKDGTHYSADLDPMK
jgi:hypothetical protein